MARFWLVVFLIVSYVYSSRMFILPLKNTDGNLDVEHVIGHMTLLEATVTSLQQTVKNQAADIVGLKTEITNLKANQQKLDARVFDLQKQTPNNQITSEVASLKNEVNAAKTEVGLVSNTVISLTSEVKNLTKTQEKLSSRINSTCATCERNLTTTVHSVQDTLNRVLTRVHSADNDRFLLHNSIQKLSQRVSELNNQSNTTTKELSAKIDKLNSEVGFEVRLKSSTTLTADASIKFDDIQYNLGGGYNSSTGVFTAPVSGTYLFWTEITKGYGLAPLRVNIVKSGRKIGTAYARMTEYHTVSIVAASRLNTGDQVSVTEDFGTGVNCCQESGFGGTLLLRH